MSQDVCLFNLYSFMSQKYPIKIIPACSTHVWWWKLRSRPAVRHSPSCASHTVASQLPFWNSFILHFSPSFSLCSCIFILRFILFILRSCCPVPGGLSVKVELFVLHSVVLKCEILVLLLLSKENCLLCKRVCILLSYLKFGRGKFAAGKFGGENMKQN